jgi:hypothetical protein
MCAFIVRGLELRTLLLLGKHSYHLNHVPFCFWYFLDRGSSKYLPGLAWDFDSSAFTS